MREVSLSDKGKKRLTFIEMSVYLAEDRSRRRGSGVKDKRRRKRGQAKGDIWVRWDNGALPLRHFIAHLPFGAGFYLFDTIKTAILHDYQ